MSSAVLTPPIPTPVSSWSLASLRRFTVDEYHRMIETGILTTDDRVELLEGYIVLKMPQNTPHASALDLVEGQFQRILPDGWFLRTQRPITLAASEPEPDGVIVRGNRRAYMPRHPGPADIGLIIEVSDSSLRTDRVEKIEIYGHAGIICYWIVNLVDMQIEVHTQPTGPSVSPGYAQRQDYRPGDSIPVTLDGQPIATIPVNELLPTP